MTAEVEANRGKKHPDLAGHNLKTTSSSKLLRWPNTYMKAHIPDYLVTWRGVSTVDITIVVTKDEINILFTLP